MIWNPFLEINLVCDTVIDDPRVYTVIMHSFRGLDFLRSK